MQSIFILFQSFYFFMEIVIPLTVLAGIFLLDIQCNNKDVKCKQNLNFLCALKLFYELVEDSITRTTAYQIIFHELFFQMYPSIQAKIWGNIGQVAELLDMVLDSFIKVSRDLIEVYITISFQF